VRACSAMTASQSSSRAADEDWCSGSAWFIEPRCRDRDPGGPPGIPTSIPVCRGTIAPTFSLSLSVPPSPRFLDTGEEA
jgi:hypothetical protein